MATISISGPSIKPSCIAFLVEYRANTTLTDAELPLKLETVGETGVSHNMIADDKGNIYLTKFSQQSHLLRYCRRKTGNAG